MSAPFGANDRRPQAEQGDERETLVSNLNFQRDTLRWKAAGLTPDELASRSVATTTMSLLGLVRHMAEVERIWRDRVAGEEDRPRVYSTPADPDADFDGAVAQQVVVDGAYADWAAAQAELDHAICGRDLASSFTTRRGYTLSVRWLLAHMIEEYARHNGHADLLREAIDGQTGD